LQFTTGRFESALQIELNKAEAEKCGWVITIESEKKVCWHIACMACVVRIHLHEALSNLALFNIMLFSSKIFAEDVNFFNYQKVDYLEAACKTSDIHKPYPYAYPPRFVLEVSARYAKQHSSIELTFTGARRDLYTEIQLHPLRCKSEFLVYY
jgi:hypothetical protein